MAKKQTSAAEAAGETSPEKKVEVKRAIPKGDREQSHYAAPHGGGFDE